MRKFFVKILCIFPFEEAFFKANGLSVKYVGNPLLDELPLHLSKAEARSRLAIGENETVVVLMPGSRPSEVYFHLREMWEAVQKVAQRLREEQGAATLHRVRVLIPFPKTTSLKMIREEVTLWTSSHREWLDVRISQGDSALCLVAADAGLVKSGTSTLEAGLLRCPHAVVYKPSRTSAWIFRHLIRYRGPVGLVNLVANEKPGEPFLVSEILCEKVTPALLAQELYSLLTDSRRRQVMSDGFEKLRRRVSADLQGMSPSAWAAQAVLQTAQEISVVRARSFLGSLRFCLIYLSSWIWGLGSAWFRKRSRKKKKLDSYVVSVGNIQVGGAGKTPLVAQIAREAAERGLTACILTRGYRSRWEKEGGVLLPGDSPVDPTLCGDEAALLHDLCPQAYIGVGSDRYRQYQAVLRQASVKMDRVILDDGFQHAALRKDLEIVALTSAQPGEVFFRDSPSALRYADLLVWTKGDVRPVDWGRPWVKVQYVLPSPSNLNFTSFWLVTGVAQGAKVYALALSSGYPIVRHLDFPDHFPYSKEKVFQLLRQAAEAGARIALTGKDWVKWRSWGVSPLDVQILEPQLQFKEGYELWKKTLWENG